MTFRFTVVQCEVSDSWLDPAWDRDHPSSAAAVGFGTGWLIDPAKRPSGLARWSSELSGRCCLEAIQLSKKAGSLYVPCGTALSFGGGSSSSKIHSSGGPFVAVAIPSSGIHRNERSGAAPVITRRPS